MSRYLWAMTPRWIWTAALLTSACTDGEVGTPERINVEVTGSPECLSTVYASLNDHGIAAATMPAWEKGIGKMEFGTIEIHRAPEVRSWLTTAACVRAIRQRPCSTPLTDVDFCNAPKRAG
ncbi:hypothetical protein [Sphingosinicella sp. BN140058]|uniref:hypothetical protein n=1 Tax=Sphingosinicella sp. BN140058 TaxID=1892855 RepID=UPI001010DEFE|nr:hypothetical protein [Sphingosinicella sp. BN140058]QAY78162.1 hypothetical protein ETR14_17730 [Sphingosinicella sp. BN140058]